MVGQQMKQYQIHRSLTILFLILALFTAYGLLHPALAIGPGSGGSKIRVDDEEHGPYILLVATAPLPVTLGQMSVWIRVTGIEDNQLRRDAMVMVEAKHREDGTILTAQGSHKNAGNDYDYVAHVPADQTGQWDVTVSVEDELGKVEVVFTETVSRGQNIAVLVAFGIPFVLLVIVVGIYLWRRSG